MRDGVTLAVDIYRSDADGQFPVLLLRTFYGRAFLSSTTASSSTGEAVLPGRDDCDPAVALSARTHVPAIAKTIKSRTA
jgi:predicted acyl esterase